MNHSKTDNLTVNNLCELLTNRNDIKLVKKMDKDKTVDILKIRHVNRGCYDRKGKYSESVIKGGFKVKILFNNGSLKRKYKDGQFAGFSDEQIIHKLLLEEISN